MKYTLLGMLALSVVVSGLSPASALALGLVLGLLGANPDSRLSAKWSKTLLQVSVVALGFGMDLKALLGAGFDGFLLSATTILATLLLGHFLAKWLKVTREAGALISAGTAICGGSAIAAVAAVIAAGEAEVTVAMGTVFLLNAVGLYVFPPLGHTLGLSSQEFGTWAGVAIHDVSSVVGAAGSYDREALLVATAVKLSRALWIIPVALAFANFWPHETKSKNKFSIPWFIGAFVLASACRTFIPGVESYADGAYHLAKIGMSVTLFLIGAGISLPNLRGVGVRPLLHGFLLWIVISVTSLVAVHLSN